MESGKPSFVWGLKDDCFDANGSMSRAVVEKQLQRLEGEFSGFV